MDNCNARAYIVFGDEEVEFVCPLESHHHGPHNSFVVGDSSRTAGDKAALIWNYDQGGECDGCNETFNKDTLQDGVCDNCDSFICEFCQELYPRGYRYSELDRCINCRF